MGEGLAVFGGSVVTAIFGLLALFVKYHLENRALKFENLELKTSVTTDFENIKRIQEQVFEIFKKTRADRFLLLMATNNSADMRFTTAFFEQHKDGTTSISFGATNRFVKFEFDSEYRKMLKQVEREDSIILETSKMNDSDLKSIYEGESVKHSIMYFLRRMPLDKNNDKLIYASVGTHHPLKFTSIELVKIKGSLSQIKEISNTFL